MPKKSTFKKGDTVQLMKKMKVVEVRSRTSTVTVDGTFNLIIDNEYLKKVE